MTIDFHTHILPSIDDGSKDLDTSLNMLQMMAAQGVDWVIATPHFYGDRDRVERFCERRAYAYEQLRTAVLKDSPQIMIGSEVLFFAGISRAGQLDALTIQETNLLLLEMPYAPWSDAEIREVEWMTRNTRYQIILAHLERYLAIKENRRGIEQLLQLPLTVQVNAGSLTDWRRRHSILRLMKDAPGCVLGSDCHGIHHRAPNLQEGRNIVRKKLGQSFLDQIDLDGSRLLQGSA
jgi:protein-tyrosine phosphatase